MAYIPQNNWNQYKDIINDFFDDIGQQVVTWKRTTIGFSRYQEGTKSSEEIQLRGLFEYPYQRKWGIDVILPEGQDEKFYGGLYLNIKYLTDLGYVTNEKFNFDVARDRFYINSSWYKCFGITPAAQANDLPLYFILILERIDKESTV